MSNILGMLIAFHFLVDVQAAHPFTLGGANNRREFSAGQTRCSYGGVGYGPNAWSDLGTYYWRIPIRGQGMTMTLLAPSHHLMGLGPPRLCPLERDMRSGNPRK